MAEYTLTNTAAVVDASIQKVANATTSPLDGSPLMVTSGGVKAYVDDQISSIPITQIGVITSVSRSVVDGSNGTGVTLPSLSAPVVTSGSVDQPTHVLSSQSSTVLTTPSQGTSVIHVSVIFVDTDSSSGDSYVFSLLINGDYIASIDPTINNNTPYLLNFTGYVPPSSTVTFRITAYSGATERTINGDITCVNYQ